MYFCMHFMNYEQTIAYLYASQPAFHQVGAAAYKPGLANTQALMAALDCPQKRFISIHIAGTNGKGSVSHLIAASLQCAGLKVGLYTSPHLVDFRERIRINGTMIPQQQVVDFVAQHQSLLEHIKPSFFETTMAMAFDYFAREKVDIAVIETGLGGRLDSTNILPPATDHTGGVVLSVITNIGFDHTEFLGDTLAKIAAEKAGIIKPGVPCVIGESHPETDPVFIARAMECGSELFFADQHEYLRRCRKRYAGECELKGIYQEHNLQTAFVALRALHLTNRESIARGFAQVCTLTGLRGRWEKLTDTPLTICDTGHNAHGIAYVAEQLRTLPRPLHIVFGMVNDKDVERVLDLLPADALYIFTQAHTHRAIPAHELQTMWLARHPQGSCAAVETVSRAVEQAQAQARVDGGSVFIGGSNYVVGEALA